jgi:hypothetical protein
MEEPRLPQSGSSARQQLVLEGKDCGSETHANISWSSVLKLVPQGFQQVGSRALNYALVLET